MLVYGHDSEVCEWVRARVPDATEYDFSRAAAIGVASGDRLIAGIVFHDYKQQFGTIELSMASESPMWARRENIAAMLAYPFVQLGCYKVYTCTRIENKRAIDVNLHIGFTREAVLAHQFGKNRHCVICRMTKPVFDKLYWVNHGLPR